MIKKEIASLSSLRVAQYAKVVNVLIENKKLRNRIFEMGITCGAVVSIKKIAPLGDPVSIIVRGYELSLRKSEVKNVLVEVIK